MARNELSAKNLKLELWDTLLDLRENKIEPARADSIACQSREILRTVRTQLAIQRAAQEVVPDGLKDFAKE